MRPPNWLRISGERSTPDEWIRAAAEILNSLGGGEREILDSIAVVRLGAFVEEEFRLAVPPEDFVIENFRQLFDLAEQDLLPSAFRGMVGIAGPYAFNFMGS